MIGGKSRRMGEHKAMMIVDGVPQVVRLHTLLTHVLGNESIICGPGEVGMPEVVRTTDREGDAGPLSGLLGFYDAFGVVDVLVIACDHFRFNEEALAWLLSQDQEGCDVVMPRFPDRGDGEPLISIYKKSAWSGLNQAYASGVRGLIRACKSLKRVEPVIPEHLIPVMRSANTPDEYRKLGLDPS